MKHLAAAAASMANLQSVFKVPTATQMEERLLFMWQSQWLSNQEDLLRVLKLSLKSEKMFKSVKQRSNEESRNNNIKKVSWSLFSLQYI